MGGMIGALSPILFKALHMDPALMAGPLETALQDMIGTSIYLTLGYLILS
jgi:Mg/Co/Ni transporter MgtE